MVGWQKTQFFESNSISKHLLFNIIFVLVDCINRQQIFIITDVGAKNFCNHICTFRAHFRAKFGSRFKWQSGSVGIKGSVKSRNIA